MDKLSMQTKNLADENYKKLTELFPNIVTETVDEEGNVIRAIDKDKLEMELATKVVEGNEERYQFTWPDKKKSVIASNAPTTNTLRPSREDSVNFDQTENLYIEGDNLEVLKVLKETYNGKVKMIYIDPPYNTGKDFVYSDNFTESIDEYVERSGDFDEEGNRLVKNLDSNGRFHTDWLNMIYPRLKLARNLLSDDGVIFISIDDNEQANLKKVCDEIFGEQNFIITFPRVTKKGGKSTSTYAKNNDYLMVYAKNIYSLEVIGLEHTDKDFKYRDEHFEERGFYKLNQTLDYNSLQYNKTMDYELDIHGEKFYPGSSYELFKERESGVYNNHDWVWRWSKSLVDFGIKNDWIVVSNTGRIYTKTYTKAVINKNGDCDYYIEYKNRTKALSSLEFTENKYSNDNSKTEIERIMGNIKFEYVKPTSLVTKLFATIGDNKESLILDFFSGFRVIIVIEANSYVNIRSSRLLPNFKTQKINSWCAA